MKRLSFALLVGMLLASVVPLESRAQDIGLYFDEARSSYCVEEGMGLYEIWIWIRPSENGTECFEFSVTSDKDSGQFLPFAPIYNTLLEDPVLGIPFSPLLLGCFTECQTDWVWIAKNSIFLQSTDPIYITIGPGNYSGNPEPYLTNCSGLDETANVLSYLIINSECVAPETEILRISVESLTNLEAEFNVDVLESDAENIGNYQIFLKDDPLSTETIIAAELAEDGKRVMLTLGSIMTPNADYTLRASNIGNIYGGTCTAADIGFFFGPDIIISAISVVPDSIRVGCASIEGEFTVKNIGFADSGAFSVSLFFLVDIGHSYVEVPIDSYECSNMASGDSTVQSFSSQLPSDIAYEENFICAVADWTGEVAELSEANNGMELTLTTFIPCIQCVEEVYNDAGGMVEIDFVSSSADGIGIENPVTGYEIYRRIDPLPAAVSATALNMDTKIVRSISGDVIPRDDPSSGGCFSAAEWELVEWVEADGSSSYSVEVPTLADSTAEHGVFWSVYIIQAVRPIDESNIYYVSCPDSGYSIDNTQFSPDLIVTDLTVTPGEIHDGCITVEIEYKIRNVGSGFAPGGVENDVRFLVNDGTNDIDNYARVAITKDMYGGLGAGDSIHVTESTALVSGMAYDQNFVEVVLDEDDYILESDEENNSLRFLMPTFIPRIESITDVVNDAGKQVWIHFLASSVDKKGIAEPLMSYDIMRDDGGEWNVIGSLPASQQSTYSVIAPTLYDDLFTFFVIRAVHPVGATILYYTSCAGSGCSIYDPPIATLLQEFGAELKEGKIELSWSMASVDDGVDFAVSRRAGGGEWTELPAGGLERTDLSYTYLDDSVEPDESYIYRVDYESAGSRTLLFQTEQVTTPAMPLALEQNVPNPFNPVTEIRYYLPEAVDVRLEVYDISGRLIERLADGQQTKGWQSVRWEGTDAAGRPVASGVYFYRLRAGKEVVSKKMILLR